MFPHQHPCSSRVQLPLTWAGTRDVCLIVSDSCIPLNLFSGQKHPSVPAFPQPLSVSRALMPGRAERKQSHLLPPLKSCSLIHSDIREASYPFRLQGASVRTAHWDRVGDHWRRAKSCLSFAGHICKTAFEGCTLTVQYVLWVCSPNLAQHLKSHKVTLKMILDINWMTIYFLIQGFYLL